MQPHHRATANPRAPAPPIITLTTDFSCHDTYVGQMKGVILDIAPEARIVDLTHEVAARDVLAGALAWASARAAFPPRTIHVGVVDPGVGTDRAAITVRTGQGTFVGPDNGLFTAVARDATGLQTVALTDPTYHRSIVSATFHGRDIFAPVAAHLATGTPLERLGDPVGPPMMLDIPVPRTTAQGLELRVLIVDRFGNLITNLATVDFDTWRSQASDRPFTINIAGQSIRSIQRTYGDVAPGEAVAYFGSCGHLEIAVRDGHAARELSVGTGTVVHLSSIGLAGT